ncbi:MAG: DNA polymerase III subunit beta [Bacteroidales bacterium]|nr:DNA polymerase III subunit beta [Bacteroidales bacterium]MCR5193349.1 DNA polymerase III subunit beta [Bacteroidales bacterium]
MRFIINSQLLLKHLTALSGVISNNNTVPIISCFHMHLENNILTIKATDLETTMMCNIELENARVDGIDTVAIPAKIMLDMLKNMDDRPLNIAVDASTFSMEISSNDGKYTIAGQNPETYPQLPAKNETVTVTIPASVIVNAINKTAFAASTDEMRQQMSGIYCELTPESATFVATDAHKLVRYRRTDVHSDELATFILPRKPITMVKNILGSNKEEFDVTMEYNNINVFFSFDNFLIICRLVDGKYPNYEAAIPKDNPNKLTIDRSTFINALRRISLFANQATHQVRLSISEKELNISSEDLEFSNNAHETLPCSYDGDPMDIGFNAKFLTEMVSNLDTEHILIELSHPSRAGIIFPINEDEEAAKGEDILMLVMPVMLAN